MQIDKTFGHRKENIKYYNRQGAYLISIQNGMAATVKTPKGYFLLGGGIEGNENHIQCIQRECLEEIGYRVVVKEYICSAEEYMLHEKLGYFHPVQFYYRGELVEKVSLQMESDHILEWIELNGIERKLCVKAQGWAIKTFLNSYIK